MYTITSLHVYPIKGMKGIDLHEATLSPMGITHDRQYMLITPEYRAITQRELPALTLCETAIYADYIGVEIDGEHLLIPKHTDEGERVTCRLFDREVEGIVQSDDINQWLSKRLGRDVLLVKKSPETPRYVRRHDGYRVHFSDGHQYLLLGEASMAHLNSKLSDAMDINRFRANIIFSGGEAHDEDTWGSISIAAHQLEMTKPCSRCKVTTVDQESGAVGLEPLRTLATYRLQDKKINFGAYYKLVSDTYESTIRVGDTIQPTS